MSPAPALRRTPIDEIGELKSHLIVVLGPAMEHSSGRPKRALTAEEIANAIALNQEVQRRERKLGLRRH